MLGKSGRLATCASLCLVANTCFAQLFFRGLGDLPGGVQNSGGLAISPDGLFVAGNGSHSDGTVEPMLWTESDGMRGLGYLPGGDSLGYAYGVSNGGIVVGTTDSSKSTFDAFRWTRNDGMSSIGSLPGAPTGGYSDALGISADGQVVAGAGHSSFGREAFRWTAAAGTVGLGDLPGGGFLSAAYGVSSDGKVIVGRGLSASGDEAIRWTESSGMVGLGDIAGGNFRSQANAASSDGSVIVGWGSTQASGEQLEAFRWSEATGMVGLGDLPGGDHFSYAEDVSGDGSIVIGVAVDGIAHYYDAFIWDQAHGMRKLQDVIQNQYGIDLSGWHLYSAKGISDDGTTIVGTGQNPNGRPEAWIFHVPEPASATLLLIAMATISRWRHAKKFREER
jgi:probable HAF family extracellular repeat protein